jgi:hypothetical protein
MIVLKEKIFPIKLNFSGRHKNTLLFFLLFLFIYQINYLVYLNSSNNNMKIFRKKKTNY